MRINSNEIYLHTIICVVLIIIPLMLQIESSALNIHIMSRFWLMVFGLLLTFYSNYLYAIDHLLYKKRYIAFVIFNLVLLVLNDVIETNVVDLINPERPHHRRPGVIQTFFVYYRLIFTALGVGASLAVRYYKKLLDSEKERKQLENEKLTSEISLLKYQMQPHFFFNTLNNIYALIAKSPNDAQKAVHSLSKMMRYILYENTSETISLTKEIEFIDNYSKLMHLRLNDKVKVTFDIAECEDGIKIPPLLLIPLVENAFKHGVSYNDESFIECRLKIEDDNLIFNVENSIITSETEDRSHSGIGLQNLKKRLEILYGEAASFTAGKTDRNTFETHMIVPLYIQPKQIEKNE
ncbi:MAG: histidine kinase [Bacteroidales bacterium]|nr:histidine kinase [Bacteroidales bacterium]